MAEDAALDLALSTPNEEEIMLFHFTTTGDSIANMTRVKKFED